jgi:predicted dehydrogenase
LCINFLIIIHSQTALLAWKTPRCLAKPLAKDLHETEELVALAKKTGL